MLNMYGSIYFMLVLQLTPEKFNKYFQYNLKKLPILVASLNMELCSRKADYPSSLFIGKCKKCLINSTKSTTTRSVMSMSVILSICCKNVICYKKATKLKKYISIVTLNKILAKINYKMAFIL